VNRSRIFAIAEPDFQFAVGFEGHVLACDDRIVGYVINYVVDRGFRRRLSLRELLLEPVACDDSRFLWRRAVGRAALPLYLCFHSHFSVSLSVVSSLSHTTRTLVDDGIMPVPSQTGQVLGGPSDPSA